MMSRVVVDTDAMDFKMGSAHREARFSLSTAILSRRQGIASC
jgi:hypothetical protein